MEVLPANRTDGKPDHEGDNDSAANPDRADGHEYPRVNVQKIEQADHWEIGDQNPRKPSAQPAYPFESGCYLFLFPLVCHVIDPAKIRFHPSWLKVAQLVDANSISTIDWAYLL